MRILTLGKYYYPHTGGIETHIKHLVSHIPGTHHVVVSHTSYKTIHERVAGITVTRLGRWFTCLSQPFTPGLIPFLARQKADIIHIHLPNMMAVIAYLLARPKGKLIVTWHSDIVRQRWLLPFIRPFVGMLLDRAQGIIVTSTAYLNTSRQLQAFRKKCTVIPLGIDRAAFKKTSHSTRTAHILRKRYGTPLVLCVGRLVSYKGIDVLIAAARKLPVQVVIVGDGPLRNTLMKRAPKNVHFCGDVADVRAYYHACDVFVLPSVTRAEAFGLVQLEAMAAKKPVISTLLPSGVPEVNLHGIMVPPRDVRALRKAIKNIVTDIPLQKRIVAKNYTHSKRFSLTAMARRTMALYRSL